MTLVELKSQLAGLRAEERAELAHFLIATLEEENSHLSDEEWMAELDRRMTAIQDGIAVAVPAREAIAELREKYA